jgi:phage terminase Nu1 subunit (DNA packaging protein)
LGVRGIYSQAARHCWISERTAEDCAGSMLETGVEEGASVEDWALAATAKRPAAMKEVKRILQKIISTIIIIYSIC